jgi:hypothetical protein
MASCFSAIREPFGVIMVVRSVISRGLGGAVRLGELGRFGPQGEPKKQGKIPAGTGCRQGMRTPY